MNILHLLQKNVVYVEIMFLTTSTFQQYGLADNLFF